MTDTNGTHDTNVSDDAVDGGTCPSCGAPVTAGDAFCEACGNPLGAAPAAAPAPDLAPGVDPAAVVCAYCGGRVLDDGFCGTCGQKARSPRDHWSEQPAAWVAGVCDRGIVHAANEDAMALAARDGEPYAVLVVCDGVTSAPHSDRAALAAARAACDHLAGLTFDAHDAGACADALLAATVEANGAAVGVAHALGDPAEAPACTFVAAVVTGPLISVAWCGDSRAYWLPDDGAAVQLTTDHSLGTELIAAGLSPADAATDPAFHTITRWLGADSVDHDPAVTSAALDGPGWVLVCSDGLWNYADAIDDMTARVREASAAASADPLRTADALVEFATAAGGHDNITAALARWEPSLRLPEPTKPDG